MRLFKNLFLWTAVFLLPNFLFADLVLLQNGKKESIAIDKISSTTVGGSGKTIPLSSVKQIIFSAPELPAKKTGIILKNGTLLSGIIRKTDKTLITFRSTSFGEIELPVSDVAVLYYFGADTALKRLQKVKNFPVLIESSGTEMSGKIVWCDSKSAGILTPGGLKKIPAENMALLAYSGFDQDNMVVLRNGDILPLPQNLNGTSLKFSFGELPIGALKTYQPEIKPAPAKNNNIKK